MPTTGSAPPALRQLAHLQCGVLLLSQALGLGMPRKAIDRHLASGQWTRIDRGLYLTRPDLMDWPARVWAASLRGGPAAVVGALSALAWHEIIDPHTGPVSIHLPADRRLQDRPYVQFRRTTAERLVVTRRSLLTTAITDAIVDAAPDLRPDALEAAIATAAQRGRLSRRRLDQLLHSRRSAPRRAALEAASTAALGGAHSSLELSYLRDVEQAHGLPTAQRQHRNGNEYRDLAYEQYATIVELDGMSHLQHQLRDRRRDNRNARAGWVTLRYGAAEVTADPCGVAREVAEVLISRGWHELPTPCPACC